VLKQAQEAAEKISNEYTEAHALRSIARLMAEIGAKRRDEELLKQAQEVWEKIGTSKAEGLRGIAIAMTEIGAKQRDEALLKTGSGSRGEDRI